MATLSVRRLIQAPAPAQPSGLMEASFLVRVDGRLAFAIDSDRRVADAANEGSSNSTPVNITLHHKF